jgi:hypothetical protein
MDDASKIMLYDSHLKAYGIIRLSAANSEVFKRAKPAASFEPDPEHPNLIRVTRISDMPPR